MQKVADSMKMLMIHTWNEKEQSYRGRFSNLLSYPSLTLSTIYSLIQDGAFSKIDIIDENSQKVIYVSGINKRKRQ